MIIDRLVGILRRWQAFANSELGERLVPLYVTLLGAAAGALLADRLVRSMWRHAIFTGYYQWRTVAVVVTVLWIAIGAVAALAALGSAEGEADPSLDPSPASTGPPAPARGEETRPASLDRTLPSRVEAGGPVLAGEGIGGRGLPDGDAPRPKHVR